MAESPDPQQRGPESDNGTVITEPVSKAGSKRSHKQTKKKDQYRKASSSISKASWVVFGSPLWHKDRAPTSVRSLPPILSHRDMEDNFVNDALKTTTSSRSKKCPIIPPYDAVKDRYARHYFKSPSVLSMMEKNRTSKTQKEFKSQHNGSNLNKLSFRRRCRLTPNADEIKARELDFINDAIPTEKRRTKYKDIIPPYSATKDSHCKAYFKRPDIKRLVTLTCSPRSPRVK